MGRKRDIAYAREKRMNTPDNHVACPKNQCVSENTLCVVLCVWVGVWVCMCVYVCRASQVHHGFDLFSSIVSSFYYVAT